MSYPYKLQTLQYPCWCYDKCALIEQKVDNLVEFNCAGICSEGQVIVSGVDIPVRSKEIIHTNCRPCNIRAGVRDITSLKQSLQATIFTYATIS